MTSKNHKQLVSRTRPEPLLAATESLSCNMGDSQGSGRRESSSYLRIGWLSNFFCNSEWIITRFLQYFILSCLEIDAVVIKISWLFQKNELIAMSKTHA